MFPGLIHHAGRPDAAAVEDAPRGGGGLGLHGHGGGPSVVLTADPKPRLRWTADLHDRFVDAVAQLGGPDSEHFGLPPSLLPQTPFPHPVFFAHLVLALRLFLPHLVAAFSLLRVVSCGI
jgi:hypothetical protein